MLPLSGRRPADSRRKLSWDVWLTAHRLIPDSALHRLPVEDQDVPLIPFPEWSAHEAEIAQVFADFMARASAAEHNHR